MILAALGVLCVGLALLGVIVPGLPTTVFLILASYLFTRSCPVLERKLLGLALFRPYLQYVNGDRRMPRRARIGALVMMWAAVATSLALLAMRQSLGIVLAVTIVSAAGIGSVMILTYRRNAAAPNANRAGAQPAQRRSTRM
jgi:uncharacterized membrane protein YbaN (DUF454 family)